MNAFRPHGRVGMLAFSGAMALVALLTSTAVAAVPCDWHSEAYWKKATANNVKGCAKRKDVNYADAKGRRPIHWAATYVPDRRLDALKALMAVRGINVNAMDKEGVTVMHIAVRYRSRAVIRMLFEGGVHPDLKDNDGITPIMIAQAKGYERDIDLLESYGAKQVCTTFRKIVYKSVDVGGSGTIGCGIGALIAGPAGCLAGVLMSLLPRSGDLVTEWKCELNIAGGYTWRF